MLTVLDGKLRQLRQASVGEPVHVLGLHPVGRGKKPLIVARIGGAGSRLYDLSLAMVHVNPEKKDPNAGFSILPIRQGRLRHLLLGSDQLYLISQNPDSRFPLAAMLVFAAFPWSWPGSWLSTPCFFCGGARKAKRQAPGKRK